MRKNVVPTVADNVLFQFSIKELETPEILSKSGTPHSKPFISNCLFEAIKAKLRNWKDVKIIYIPKWLNPNRKHPNHFLWLNTKLNLCYEFTTIRPVNTYKLPLSFMKGCISVYNMDYYNNYMNRLLKARYHQLEKKLMFKNKIFEEQSITDKELSKTIFSYARNFTWKEFPKDGLHYTPITEDEENGYDTYVICFEENYNFSSFDNTRVCKVTKNGLDLPIEMKNKKPYWYTELPSQSLATVSSYFGVSPSENSPREMLLYSF